MNHGNSAHGTSHTPVDMTQYNGSYNNMVPSAGLDINNLNTIHMNLGSFTPNMMGSQHQQQNVGGAPAQDLSQSPSM